MDNLRAMEEKGANNTPPANPDSQRKSLFANRWIRGSAYAVAALVGFWALAWLAVPPLAKWQGEKIGSEQLGRKVTIGAIDLKPWTMELTVHDLSVASADGSTQQFSFKRLYANAELESLWRWAPVIEGLQIEQPVLRITHEGDGHYDIDDILKRIAAQPKEKEPESKPARFALYNIDLNGGSIDFDDKTVDRKHEVRELRLSLPFISNLPSQLKVKVLPHLAFVANGSQFDSTAQSLPFAESLQTSATLKLSKLDLAPYLAYIPAGLPLQLKAATIDAELSLGFEQTPKPSLKLGGNLEVSGLKSLDMQGDDALSFDALKVELAEVRPLEQFVRLSSVELNRPQVSVRRDKQGLINLLVSESERANGQGEAQAVAVRAEVAASDSASKPSTEKKAAVPVWQLAIDKLAVHGGAVHFTDETTADADRPAANVRLNDFEVAVEAIGYPFAKPMSFKGSATLVPFEERAVASLKSRPTPRASKPSEQQPAGKTSSLEFEGTATDQAAEVSARVGQVPLALASPYLAQTLIPNLTGHLDAQLGLHWAPPETRLTAERLVLSNLQLTERGASARAPGSGRRARQQRSRLNDGQLVSVKQVELANAQVDLRTHAVNVGKLIVADPALRVERDENKRWMFESWLREPVAAVAPTQPERSTNGPQGDAPWKVLIEEFDLSGGMVGWRDAAMPRTVRAELTQLKLNARKLDLDGGKPIPVTISTLIGTGRAEPGRLGWQGTVSATPLVVQGALDAQRLPVNAFEPYFADALNIDILRADASFKGQVAYKDTPKGPQAKVSGDALVEELRTHSRPLSPTDANAPEKQAESTTRRSLSGTTTTTSVEPAAGSGASRAPVAPTSVAGGLGEEFLSWKQLKLGGLEVAVEPDKPAQVEVKNTQLSDFYARLIIHPDGRINLQDIVKSKAGQEASAGSASASAASTSSSAAAASGMPAAGESSAGAVQASTAVSAAVVVQPADPNAPVIRFGPIQLVNGKVLFSDRFVRPNYSADLTELNGSLSAFSSVAPAAAPQMADLQLTGRAEGSAALEITGKLNPLAKPLALDIKGQVRDLELPPLSPYSVKYAGHGIERGKLSVDVAYAIQPDGRLTASNKLVLNQLEFGEPVAGAPASLPVKLATALLADSNGVIDLDLPISGSLNDPQFSLGPIIFKAVVNLIGRAITAPFTLLARALGGGSGSDDLSNVPFAPGSATLSADARSGLDKIAKALTDRPALKVTVVGTANLESEREGWQREHLKALVAAEKRSQVGSGATGSQGNGAAPSISLPASAAKVNAVADLTEVNAEEYAELLKQVYRRADLPGKPRNALGFAKNVPVADMEALLLSHISVSEDAMRQLAVQRGTAVKDYLASKKLPAERLFLGAARTGNVAKEAPEGALGPSNVPAGQRQTDRWTPRAELNLSAR